MSISYIPIVLNTAVLSDGEAAQLLSMTNNASTPAAVTLATNSGAKPYRSGKMRAMFLLQFSDGGIPDDAQVLIRIRSPFAGDAGAQANRPSVWVSPATQNSAAVTFSDPDLTAVSFWGGPTGGLPGASAPLVAADFAATFNGKPIPNWGVTVGHLTDNVTGELGCYVTIEFGASAAN